MLKDNLYVCSENSTKDIQTCTAMATDLIIKLQPSLPCKGPAHPHVFSATAD